MEFTIAATSHEPTCCRARHNLEESSHAHVRPPATCFNCAVILTTPVGVVMTTHVLRKFQPSGMPPLFFFFFFCRRAMRNHVSPVPFNLQPYRAFTKSA